MPNTILVTGGAGFIGSHLCERLLRDGHRVISLDSYFTGSADRHVPGVEYRQGHTRDIAKHVPESVDIVFHLGEYARVEKSFEDPMALVWDMNIAGTFSVLEFCRERNAKLVYAGSSTKFSTHGDGRDQSPYAWSKASNTDLVQNYGAWFGLRYAIAYFYNVYGQGELATGPYATVLGIFKEEYRRGAPITVTRPGTQRRCFTHISDVVDGLVRVAERGEGDGYSIGHPESHAILDVARLFGDDVMMLPERKGNRLDADVDPSRMRAMGWEPRVTLADHIREFCASSPRGDAVDKRVLVFSTTFYPVEGPAEAALLRVIRALPDIHFDVITTQFDQTSAGVTPALPNVTVHRVGNGNRRDKYRLPFLGAQKARELAQTHQYLFAWSIMASYAALAGARFRGKSSLPLLVSLADHRLDNLSLPARIMIRFLLGRADQVSASDADQERGISRINPEAQLTLHRRTGDPFVNQIRFIYNSELQQMHHTQLQEGASPANEAPRRVLIFSTAYFPMVGGAEVAMKEVTDRITDIRFDLICARIRPGLPSTERIGNVTVHRVGFGHPMDKYLLPLFGSVRALFLEKPDSAWSLMASYGGFAALAYTWLRPSSKLLLTLQEGNPLENYARRTGWLTFLHKAIFRRANAVQSISKFLAAWAVQMGFRGTPEVIPNGVDLERFMNHGADKAAVRKEYGFTDNDVVIITASRLSLKNGVDNLIQSLVNLPVTCKLLIAGEGEDHEKLLALTRENGLNDRVVFAGGVSHQELPGMLAASDIFIRPSRSEGLGNAFLEAMAAGIPIVGTPVGGIPDFLTDGVTGVFCKPDDPDSIARAVQRILSEPGLRERLITNGMRLVQEEYGWEGIARRIARILRHLTARRAA